MAWPLKADPHSQPSRLPMVSSTPDRTMLIRLSRRLSMRARSPERADPEESTATSGSYQKQKHYSTSQLAEQWEQARLHGRQRGEAILSALRTGIATCPDCGRRLRKAHRAEHWQRHWARAHGGPQYVLCPIGGAEDVEQCEVGYSTCAGAMRHLLEEHREDTASEMTAVEVCGSVRCCDIRVTKPQAPRKHGKIALLGIWNKLFT
ncbi:hypothetical protein BC834DRAFT_427174 [Gloeopeniophorella convolvens]|nr:hypothetical protein BC834DRAFT_427174 [Gloeopeniophorella convolvens]